MKQEISRIEYARLVREYAPQVLDLIMRLLQGRREAEDTAQDALVKAYEKRASFRGESSFLTWLLRIAYHEALDHLRQRGPFMEDIGELTTVIEEEDLSTQREERILLMEEAVEELPEKDQLLLHLFYYEDRPLRDIAYIMDAEPNTLSQRLSRLRKKLFLMIKKKENE